MVRDNREYRSMAAPFQLPAEGAARRFESTHYVEGVAARFGQPYEIYEYYEIGRASCRERV